MPSIHNIRATRKVKPLEERLWAKIVVKGPDECWNWTAKAKANGGYGRLSVPGGRQMRAHRIAWELKNGPIPENMVLCHRCDNPACCNPDHLFIGTHKDNSRDMQRKGRASPPPIFYGDRHHEATIPDSELPAIKTSDKTLKTLAAEYRVSVGTIWRIRHGLVRNYNG
jgi:hypothetical protein